MNKAYLVHVQWSYAEQTEGTYCYRTLLVYAPNFQAAAQKVRNEMKLGLEKCDGKINGIYNMTLE